MNIFNILINVAIFMAPFAMMVMIGHYQWEYYEYEAGRWTISQSYSDMVAIWTARICAGIAGFMLVYELRVWAKLVVWLNAKFCTPMGLTSECAICNATWIVAAMIFVYYGLLRLVAERVSMLNYERIQLDLRVARNRRMTVINLQI